MIKFDYRNYKHSNGTCFIKYEEIERLTELLLSDYDKTYLSNPHKLEYDDFLLNYLEAADVTYADIFFLKGESPILGCTLFNEGTVKIFNQDRMCIQSQRYPARTVVLDNAVVTGERAAQEAFTGFHEAGHLWMHENVYTKFVGQLSVVDEAGIVYCHRADIFQGNGRKLNTELDRREWQANAFAATIALPSKSLDIVMPEIFKQYGIDQNVLVMDADDGAERLALYDIPNQLKKIYGISKETIRYRLEKKEYFMTKKQYEEKHSQMSIFDFI